MIPVQDFRFKALMRLLFKGPEPEFKPLPDRHDAFCNCPVCLDLAAAMDRYLSQKRSDEQNGF